MPRHVVNCVACAVKNFCKRILFFISIIAVKLAAVMSRGPQYVSICDRHVDTVYVSNSSLRVTSMRNAGVEYFAFCGKIICHRLVNDYRRFGEA